MWANFRKSTKSHVVLEEFIMIEIKTIVVTSLGRTGTKFFSVFFREILSNCSSFHEPDIFQYFGTKDLIGPFFSRVKDAGIKNMVFLKLLGKWSLFRVSDSLLRGEINKEEAIKEILWQRKEFILSKPGDVFVESNAGYYGLIPILNHVFTQHRAIYIVRNGIDWITSTMNVGELYGKKGLREILSHKMPTAMEFPSDPLHNSWGSITRFEKLCWAWSKINTYAYKTISENPYARMYKFEDIFSMGKNYDTLNDLVTFTTSMAGINPRTIGSTVGWLDMKIHESTTQFSNWDGWSEIQKSQFKILCGPLMEELGYSF